MNNKLNNMINQFLENSDAKNEEELNKQLQEFIVKYNNGEIEYENTPLDDAYELLEQAEKTKSQRKALQLAQQAYEQCPACFDALLFQLNFEKDPIKEGQRLDDGLAKEKERLVKEGYFAKDNIGSFYGIFETRPYIRGLYRKANDLLFYGQIKQARDLFLEILHLNKNDNTGARYLLMGIYAYLEDEKGILKLYKKYPEEQLEMLLPLFSLYYKLGDDKKAKEYLGRIHKANPNFVKFFQGKLKEKDDTPEGYYSKGKVSEVLVCLDKYMFLLDTMNIIASYICNCAKTEKLR